MEEIGIPELNLKQLEELCEMAEANARECVLSKFPSHKVFALNVSLDGDGTRPLMRAQLAEDATERAFTSVEVYFREFSCKFTR